MTSPNQPSKILLDEYFLSQDDRFLDELAKFSGYGFLSNFVQKWIADTRPWAQQQITAYVMSNLNLPGHEVVFKRLFKHVEQSSQHDVMAEFMVALDRLVRRRIVQQWYYDRPAKRFKTTARLFAKSNRAVVQHDGSRQQVRDPSTGEMAYAWVAGPQNTPDNRLFTQRTRAYLRRRAWRYFRKLSHSSPADYRAAICHALVLYNDDDFTKGENILDNWSLMHACYFHHPSVQFGPSHARLASGRTLSDLSAAPYQPTVWQSPDALEPLIELLQSAQSALVRIWTMEVLRDHHRQSLASVPIELLVQLLSHNDVRTQEFAVELFRSHPQLATLGIDAWLRLLESADPMVLPTICDSLREQVASQRLSPEQIIQLCIAQPTPVAQLGLELLRGRHKESPLTDAELLPLAEPQCESAASEIAEWATRTIGGRSDHNRDAATTFLDSSNEAIRTAWLNWLTEEQSPGFSDPALWSRLVESPYDDVRFRIIESLERKSAPLKGQASLNSVWASVLLNIKRGNRTKVKAIRQMTQAIGRDPTQAETLLPVVAIAVRSVRATERRGALAAVVTLAGDDPGMRQQVRQHLPELNWVGDSA